MEKELNLIELLKGTPKGTKLYSPIFGECEFNRIDSNLLYVTIKDSCTKFFFEDGSYYDGGECLLFPSKENRDWSTFKVEEGGFKVGDYIKEKDSNNVFKIKQHDGTFVVLERVLADLLERKMRADCLDRYEKVEKFDPKWLKPFDRVLVREPSDSWFATLFSHLRDDVRYPYVINNNCAYKYCIPYNEETKSLVGTSNEEPEFYKI